MASLYRFLMILLTLIVLRNFNTNDLIYSEGRPLDNQCRAQTALEGETAVLNFSLPQNTDFNSGKVLATLRRAKKTNHTIVVCRRLSPLKCTFNDPADQDSSGIVNHVLMLRIPNITKDLEDTYNLKIYVNDKMQPLQSCNLTVRPRPSNQHCSAPSVVEGDTGVMKFFVGKKLSMSSDVFSATLTRNGDQGELISCRRQAASARVQCDIQGNQDKHFETDGFAEDHLTVFIPNIKKEFEDTYRLRVLADSTGQSSVSCFLQINDAPALINGGALNTDNPWTSIVIAILLAIIAAVLVAIYFRQACPLLWRRCGFAWTEKADTKSGSTDPLLSRRGSFGDTESHENKRWFYGKLSDEAEKKLLQSKSNGQGSFLVKFSRTNRKHYILSVLLGNGMKYLTIIPKQKQLFCPSTRASFDTLCGLVDYYKQHEIRVQNKLWGTLYKPFESDPEGDWYFGKLSGERVQWILQKNGPGSFLITASNTDEDGYYLSVNLNKEALHFVVTADDDGFKMLDTGKTFKKMSECVEYYTYNDLTVDENTNYGRLCKPCTNYHEDLLTLEDLAIETAKKRLKSKRARPGSFWFAKDNVDTDIYILAVFFDGEIQRFRIKQERHGFFFIPTDTFFRSLYELLDYHKEHTITTNDKIWGKLSKPFTKEPEDDWYVGPLRREDEKKMLLATKNKQGAFLIREDNTEQDNYVLAMNFKGETEIHVIIPEGNGFKLIDANDTFASLSLLVKHYQDHIIPPDYKGDMHRLSHPCVKDPPDIWYCARFTRDDEKLYLQSKRTRQGSFLITTEGDMPSVYTLAVHFDGKMKKFQVTQKGNGFVFETTNMFFYTWCELVDYYRKHDIKTGDRLCGKLSRPLRKEPTETWYFANTAAEEEAALFRCSKEGSFLIRDGTTESDEYVLAVRRNDTTKHFLIRPEEDGFNFGDAVTVFGTLAELVKYYQENDILFAGRSFGRLGTPLRRN